MFGNCATGRLAIVTAPTITIRMAITIATIGRLMKKLDMDLDSFRSNFEIPALTSSAGAAREEAGLLRFSKQDDHCYYSGTHVRGHWVTNGLGCTVVPGRRVCWPCATTRSPGFSPSWIIHMVPTRSPTFTERMAILLSCPTTLT